MTLLRRAAVPFALFTVIGLLFFGYHYLDDLARMQHGTMLQRFIEEMSGAYTALMLMPFVLWFIRRFAWPWQFLGAAAYSIAHTTLMEVSRDLLFRLAGLGAYDYGIMSYRYPMEASHDAIIYAVFVGLVYFYDRARNAREAELAAVRLQTELAKAKLENLRLQLEPHFLFNTLNAISSVMYEDVRKADAMLARLSSFLRIILSTADAAEVTLDEELQIQRMYVDIMKARMENRLALEIEADADARLARIPPLLLQPIVENAIRHGMADGRDHLRISVHAARRADAVEIRISEDGAGLQTAEPAFNHGLANVRARLAHLHGESAAIRISQLLPAGTETLVRLPFRS